MLDGPDPVVEARHVVVGQDGDGLLRDDRPAVERGVHEVDRAAGDGDAVGQRVRHGMTTGERRQQRRMRVEDPSAERREDRRPDDPHVARQDDRVDTDRGQRLGERRIVAARDERGLDPLLGRPVERGAGTIGEHEDDDSAELAAIGGRRERPQVRPRARDADGDPAAQPAPSSGPST